MLEEAPAAAAAGLAAGWRPEDSAIRCRQMQWNLWRREACVWRRAAPRWDGSSGNEFAGAFLVTGGIAMKQTSPVLGACFMAIWNMLAAATACCSPGRITHQQGLSATL